MLAAQVAGSETRFVAEMNAEARALGMDHTIYTDPSGFDPSTVSTAADQLRVFRRAMRFPVFRQIVSMASVTLPVAGTLTNYNPLIAEGYAGKTGSDSAAGGCLAFFTHVTVGGRRLTAVGVVMGQGQGNDTSALLAAAGEAAQQLVDPSPRRSACARSCAWRGQGASAPDGRRRCRLPVAPGAELMSTQSLPAGEHMNRRRRPLAALALIAMVALISACGSSAPARQRSSGGGSSTAATAQKAVKFAECMRSNGVSEFPDPSASGKLHHRCDRERLVAGHEHPGVHAGPQRVQEPGAGGVHGQHAERPAAGGGAQVRPVHPRQRRERLSRTPPTVSPSSTRIESHPPQRAAA